MLRAIIMPHARGGGDHLLHAVLAELYSRVGYEVFVSTRMRPWNDEIAELVWDRNPFVRGWSDEEPTAGLRGRVADYGRLARLLRDPSLAIAALHDFTTSFRPKALHYTPRTRADLKDVILADPTSHTQAVSAEVFKDFTEYVCRDFDARVSDVVLLRPKIVGQYGRDSLHGNPIYSVADIFEYVDAIASARAFLATESLGQSIGAHVRRGKPTFSIHSCKAFNEKLFIWPGVTYSTDPRIDPTPYHSGVYPC